MRVPFLALVLVVVFVGLAGTGTTAAQPDPSCADGGDGDGAIYEADSGFTVSENAPDVFFGTFVNDTAATFGDVTLVGDAESFLRLEDATGTETCYGAVDGATDPVTIAPDGTAPVTVAGAVDSLALDDVDASLDTDADISYDATSEWQLTVRTTAAAPGETVELRADGAAVAESTVTDDRRVTFTMPAGTHTYAFVRLAPPSAALSVSPSDAITGSTVTFDASGSADPDGTIVTYRWDLDGDREIDRETSSPVVETSYDDPGVRIATVYTVDDDGNVDTTREPVIVEVPVSAALNATPSTAAPNESVTLDAGASTAPDLNRFEWDLDGDGTFERDTEGPTLTTAYDEAGEYDPTVRIVDESRETDTASTPVTVTAGDENEPPVARIDAPSSATVGQAVTFDGSDSTDPDGSVASYAWDVDGDGQPEGTDPVLTYTPTAAGDLEVTLNVTDDAGATNTTTTTVTVEVANETTVPPVVGDEGPTDPDGDGQFEDVDGDGQTDLFDALTYYNQRDSAVIENNPDAFDFDDDGDAGGLFDAIALYNEISD